MRKYFNPYNLIGVAVLPIIWLFLSYAVSIDQRYLPTPYSVFQAASDLSPNILLHFVSTTIRLLVGVLMGVAIGMAVGISLSRSRAAEGIISPVLHALRAVPPVAIVPFFLLWFGFAETGKYLIVILGVGVNIALSTHHVLSYLPEKYDVYLKFRGSNLRRPFFGFDVPYVLENIQGTLRFMISLAIGLVIVSELLGSQVGLGYVIQTSRSTFSFHAVMLACLAAGICATVVDVGLMGLVRAITFWRK